MCDYIRLKRINSIRGHDINRQIRNKNTTCTTVELL